MNYEESIFFMKNLNVENKFKTEDILFLTRINESLVSIDIESVYDELTLMIKRYMDVKELKIYNFNLSSQSLRLKLYIGEDSDPERSFLISKKPHLAQAIFYHRAVRSHLNPNLYYMFLKVNNIPIGFIEVSTTSTGVRNNEDIELFEGLVNFIGRILESNKLISERYSETLEKKIMTRGEFEKRLNCEKRRKENFNTEYSLVSFRMSNKNFDFFKESLLKLLRETDYVTYEYENERLLFLLSCTPETNKIFFRERISKFLENLI